MKERKGKGNDGGWLKPLKAEITFISLFPRLHIKKNDSVNMGSWE